MQGTSTIVSNLIGAFQADLAYRFYWLIFRLELLINTTILVLVIVFSKEIADFFAKDDKELYQILILSMPFAGVLMASEFGSIKGTFFALGEQRKFAPVYLGAQYIIALPLAIVFTKTYDYGAKGIYMAQATGSFLLFVCSTILLQVISFEECA